MSNTQTQNEVIDFFDSILLYASAIAWQMGENDHVSQLRAVGDEIWKTITSSPLNLSEDESSLSYALIMGQLQRRNGQPILLRPNPKHGWSIRPTAETTLASTYLKYQTELLEISTKLINYTVSLVDSSKGKIPFGDLIYRSEEASNHLFSKLNAPIHHKSLVRSMFRIFSKNSVSLSKTGEFLHELIMSYTKEAEVERLRFLKNEMIQTLIEAYEKPTNSLIIRIDKHYDWALLSHIDVTLEYILLQYKEMHLQRLIKDARFSPSKINDNKPIGLSFSKLKILQSFFKEKCSPPDFVRNHIFNTKAHNIQINGQIPKDSLTLSVPLNMPVQDIAKLVGNFQHTLRNTLFNRAPVACHAEIQEALSGWEKKDYKRVMIKDMGAVTGRIAGLLCDEVYRQSKRTGSCASQKPKSIIEAAETVAEFLKPHALTFNPESIVKSRSQAIKKIKDIPKILKLDN
ncbi:hypothetical protein ABFV51_04865 [Pseudomonas asgharzadehiana]|uniref:hypothetical protein n=1 Tax=Pseudomonas asgharzadehiana TaxID=2842349 RepID=UPI0034D46C13